MASSVKPFAPARVDPVIRGTVDQIGARLSALGHELQRDDPPYPLVNPVTSRYLGGIAQALEGRDRQLRGCPALAAATGRCEGDDHHPEQYQ